MTLEKYSIGVGDRFGREGKAQLAALFKAREQGTAITPVWNKSFREHEIIGTQPADTRRAAEKAVRESGWRENYFVDADHIGMGNVDLFIESSDFFTIDVADFIGSSAGDDIINDFVRSHRCYAGALALPGMDNRFEMKEQDIERIARKYLCAVAEAGRIYRRILDKKEGAFLVEVSMDETETPQSPVEIFFILAAIAEEGIPLTTIAPKFTGRFNKGVDYEGDVALFRREFEQDLAAVAFAVKEFSLPEELKLSVHSGSDKFAIYGIMREAIQKHGSGLHLKTAGTTWLEELIGLAEAGGEGLALAKEIYTHAYMRFDELSGPYAAVIDIDFARLPAPTRVSQWDSGVFAATLRHDPLEKHFNRHFRQLLHVGYKIAAEMGDRYLQALDEYKETIGGNVTHNLYERHIKKLFL